MAKINKKALKAISGGFSYEYLDGEHTVRTVNTETNNNINLGLTLNVDGNVRIKTEN